MSTSDILLLGLVVGLPCTLLALALVYHARAAHRMPAADAGWDPDAYDEGEPEFAAYMPEHLAPAARAQAPAAEALSAPEPAPGREPDAVRAAEPDPAMIALQQMVADLHQQLAGQRNAVAGLLSERERAAQLETARPTPMAAYVAPEEIAHTDLHGAVRQLVAEGLSERAIARRLHIGLEEVRLASRRERVS